MLKIQLDKLSKLLQQYTIPKELEEEMLVQLAQEELDEIRNLVEDELDNDYYNDYYNQQGSLVEDKILVYKIDQKERQRIEVVIPYYPTPSPSLLASMLAIS